MICNTDACCFSWRHNLCANICILIISKYKNPILLYCQLTIAATVTIAAVATNSASEGSTVLYLLVLWFDSSISVLYVLNFQFICTSCTMAFDTLYGNICFRVCCFMLRIPSMCYV